MMFNKQFNTFAVIITEDNKPVNAVTFHIIGYDRRKISNIDMALSEMIQKMKSRGDFEYETKWDFIDLILEEAWRLHIHLEYDYPTFGTFTLN